MKRNRLLFLLALLMTAATGAWAQTTVNGLFTVNADGDQVQFASGNLRYTSGAWSFFDHQYDYYAEYSADSWDKFGWSTSGTTYGMSTSTNESLYKGDFVDWGNAVGTGWRTLSNDEWAYVVNTRSGSTIGTTANARFAKAVVCDVKGLILFPDTYTHPNGVTAPTGINDTGATGMNGNSYDATAWALMESAGCVFLPTAGGRYHYSNPTLVINAGNEGCYWSSTSNNSTATLLSFKPNTFDPSITDSPRMGYSVRLVKSVTTYTVSLADNTEDADSWKGNVNDAQTDVNLPIKKLEGGEKVTLKYNGRLKVKSVTATTDAEPDAWDGDLSKLTAESTAEFATATDGMTITGRLGANVKVSIAADATVTLDGVIIVGDDDENYKWAGLNCLGDATIILKDGTENSVSGFNSYYPGIHVPAGSTLTITGGSEGNGELTAISSGYGAGIGGGYQIPCGNIYIQGGNITARGGIYGAGIGGGYQIPCGNIYIQGGNIMAMGGPEAAGIGGGSYGSCGAITITNDVTRVYATKGGEDAPYSIGAGNRGSCVTVSIGGTVYWENNAAVDNYANTYLGQSSLYYRPTPQP